MREREKERERERESVRERESERERERERERGKLFFKVSLISWSSESYLLDHFAKLGTDGKILFYSGWNGKGELGGGRGGRAAGKIGTTI